MHPGDENPQHIQRKGSRDYERRSLLYRMQIPSGARLSGRLRSRLYRGKVHERYRYTPAPDRVSTYLCALWRAENRYE